MFTAEARPLHWTEQVSNYRREAEEAKAIQDFEGAFMLLDLADALEKDSLGGS